MRFGVVVFPGSNCDHDCYHALKHVLRQEVQFLWHKDHALPTLDVVVLPGGFSYGDYLRTGAIARFSPLMEAIVRFAETGGLVIGICNGFQILCEAGLLPGALMKNRELHFVSRYVYVRVEHTDSAFTHAARKHVLRLPIAHGDGSYFASDDELQKLITSRQVLLRYCDALGEAAESANPNGSLDNIAGITNTAGNVMGLMPHPERAAEAVLGSADGLEIFRSVITQAV